MIVFLFSHYKKYIYSEYEKLKSAQRMEKKSAASNRYTTVKWLSFFVACRQDLFHNRGHMVHNSFDNIRFIFYVNTLYTIYRRGFHSLRAKGGKVEHKKNKKIILLMYLCIQKWRDSYCWSSHEKKQKTSTVFFHLGKRVAFVEKINGRVTLLILRWYKRFFVFREMNMKKKKFVFLNYELLMKNVPYTRIKRLGVKQVRFLKSFVFSLSLTLL